MIGDNWGKLNVSWILDNIMELLLIFLGAVVVLWLCRALSLIFRDVCLRGKVSWHLQLSAGSGNKYKSRGASSEVREVMVFGESKTVV